MSDTGTASKKAALIWAIIFVVLFDIILIIGQNPSISHRTSGLNSTKFTLIMVLSILAIPLGVAGYIIGNKVRVAIRPDFVVTNNGTFGLIFQKLFWRWGPQLVGCAGTVFAAWGILFMLIGKSSIGVKAEAQAYGRQQEQIQEERAAAAQEIGEPKPAVLDTRTPISREEFMRQYVNVDFEECDGSRLEGMLKRGSKNLKVTGELPSGFYIDSELLAGAYFDLTDLEGIDNDDNWSTRFQGAKCIIFPKSLTVFRPERICGAEIVVLNEGLTTIGDSDDGTFDRLKHIYLPATLKEIGRNAFHDRIRDTGCPIESIVIPASVERMGVSAFSRCKQLTEVYFEPGSRIKEIYGFNGCEKLKTISIPDSVERLDIYAELEEIKISVNSQLTNITYIPDSLSAIYIPPTVTEISGNLEHLTTVVFACIMPPDGINEWTFKDGVIQKIYVPAESLKAYEDAWFNYDWAVNVQFSAISE